MRKRFFIPTTRMEAFSDGVFAIVMTLLAFQFRVPKFTENADLSANLKELMEVLPNILSFIFAFTFIAVFWINHHQLFHVIKDADRKLLWLNINLLFWITMIPFSTAMVGDYYKVPLAAIILAVILLMVSVSSYLLRKYSYNHATIIEDGESANIIKEGFSKNFIAILINVAAIPVAFVSTKWSYILFFGVLVLFSIPHRSEIKQDFLNK